MRELVMVVEGNTAVRQALGEVLQHVGYAVRTVASSEAAVAALAHGVQPAVLLLDLDQPQSAGWSLLARLSAQPLAPCAVIAMSTQRDDMRELLAFALGAGNYLTKPMSLAALKCAVDSGLERCRASF
jgi:CheY-like chemotaxis protein